MFAQSLAILSGLNIWLSSHEEEPVVHIPGNADLSSIRDKLGIHALLHIPHVENDPVLLYRDNRGFSYIHGSLPEGTMLCGPFYDTEYPYDDSEQKDFAMRLNLPAIDSREITAVGQLIRQYTTRDHEDILRRIPKASTDSTHNPAQDDLNRMNQQIIDESYGMERKIRNFVADGDREGMKNFLLTFSPTETMIRRLPHNPLRQAKNGCIILNTILRLSAERGGLIPIHLHGMSSEFAGRIEQAKNTEELDELRKEMCLGYCDAVYKFSLKNHSAPIRKTSEYILTHLDEKLSLSALAEKIGCSAPYLARQFKKEYGISVGDFIRNKKMDEAKYLLSNSGDSLLDIAVNLGYEDLGYFSRVFRTITGMSPSAYRNKVIAGIGETTRL